MGTPSVDTTTDVKVDTDTVTPGIVNPAIAGTTALAVTTDKTKNVNNNYKKIVRPTKLVLCVKALHFLVLKMMSQIHQI